MSKPFVYFADKNALAILTEAFDKAIANGWDMKKVGLLGGWERAKADLFTDKWYESILDHEFGKALWEDQWQYHIGNIALTDDPLLYLKEHI